MQNKQKRSKNKISNYFCENIAFQFLRILRMSIIRNKRVINEVYKPLSTYATSTTNQKHDKIYKTKYFIDNSNS